MTQSNPTPNKIQLMERLFDAGLKLVSAENLKSKCPDSWTFALYVQGQLEESKRREVNAHIAFCSDCYREYLALAEPEDVMREMEQELLTSGTTISTDAPAGWAAVLQRVKDAVIDFAREYGENYLIGPARIIAEASAVTTRGTRAQVKFSKLLEMSVGDNTYSIEMGVLHDGSLRCEIDGKKNPHKIPLRVVLRQETGEALLPPKQTNIHGNGDFVVSSNKLLGGMLVLDLHLNGHESQIAFVLPDD